MLSSNDSTSTDLIIGEFVIPRDTQGRYNLNALHRKSDCAEDPAFAPSRWTRLKSTKALVAELHKQKPEMAFDVVVGGAAPGVYAHELLALSYAGWISPAFQLVVNQAFIAMHTRRMPLQHVNPPSQAALLKVQYALAEAQTVLTEEVEQLKARQDRIESRQRALETRTPPPGRLLIADWIGQNGKPRLYGDMWTAMKARCKTIEPPVMFRPEGMDYPLPFYTPETIARAYTEVTRQISFIHEAPARYGRRPH